MDRTQHLSLPYIMPEQAQKFFTHNQGLNTLDGLVMLAVTSRSLSLAPATPALGGRYIVAAAPTGAWSGQADMVALFQDNAWTFLTPQEGWLAWCSAETQMLVFTDSSWRPLQPDQYARLGINTDADLTNRLAVSAPATLLTHEGGSHRLVVNKASGGDTASLVFQNDYSGRAELGLAGDDRLSFKVSADGSTFVEAMSIDPATGKPSFPQAKFLSNYAVNLYQDSGRFGGNGVTGTSIAAFAFPNYLTPYNGATVTGLAKFIHNNNDYGGASGALNAHVRDLIDTIRDASYRRYGPEFWVAQITMGSGTGSGPALVDDLSGYFCLFGAFTVQPPAMTFHAYVRALDQAIIVKLYPGQTATANGTTHGETFAISPADNWVSVTIAHDLNPRTSNGYNPSPIGIYVQDAGDKFLLACPALMGGIATIDDNVGVIASYNSWSA
ncbi:DUF2793 domain-containing protein [Devosia rhodophyticola]|uniref:DUF2793 domain-containing protein n=1 Tax=Devosia rhodophyticola TaxID=3026423 RepID=A0ABY7YZA1_9HYPH|nr:DUF2793 domain-containing protein [Devosia rhodophyticola]WDR06696.1 DUF2793 domain-containing protein [Devosia rhodophyticola]